MHGHTPGRRNKQGFTSKSGASIRMKLGERENMLIKDDISRYIYATSGYIKALEAFMKIIPKKNTLLRTESKFMGIIGTKIWPTCATKRAERGIINLLLEKFV
jgi:hypothetical protein